MGSVTLFLFRVNLYYFCFLVLHWSLVHQLENSLGKTLFSISLAFCGPKTSFVDQDLLRGAFSKEEYKPTIQLILDKCIFYPKCLDLDVLIFIVSDEEPQGKCLRNVSPESPVKPYCCYIVIMVLAVAVIGLLIALPGK